MPFGFLYLKELGRTKLSSDTCCANATFDNRADVLETLLWHFLQKLLRFLVLLSTAPKPMTSLGKHGWRALRRKHRTAQGSELLPLSPIQSLSSYQMPGGLWKGFPLSSSGDNYIPAVLSSSGIRCQYLKSISQNPVKAGRLAM